MHCRSTGELSLRCTQLRVGRSKAIHARQRQCRDAEEKVQSATRVPYRYSLGRNSTDRKDWPSVLLGGYAVLDPRF